MKTYTLFCYDSSVDMFCEYTSKSVLKDLKRLVADARNDHSLSCRMYISDGKRIVKKYDAVEYTDGF